MSVINSIKCPVCHSKDEMQEDYDESWAYYFCFNCGYGIYVREKKSNGENLYFPSGRYPCKKFAKTVTVNANNHLCMVGEVTFYPNEIVYGSEYAVYPAERNGSLVWKLYDFDRKQGGTLLGTFSTFKEADTAGERYMGRILVNDSFIDEWLPKYDDWDEQEYKAICDKLEGEKETGFKFNTFKRIIRWKARGRIDRFFNEDNFAEVRKRMNACKDSKVPYSQKLAGLIEIRGIDVPVASTILHFLYPNKYPIIDVRTSTILHIINQERFPKIEPRKRNCDCGKIRVPFHVNPEDFLEEVKRIRSDCSRKWTLRKIDKAIFAYHKHKWVPDNEKYLYVPIYKKTN